jgi:hypothetical protein
LRLLYDGRSESPEGTHRFRLAVALAPPDRMRLEILPPVGGPRLVVTADGRRLLALDPARRRAETWEPEAEGTARLLGASLGAADLRTLLEGRSPCGGSASVAGASAECPFGGWIYRPETGGDGAIKRATLLDAAGVPLLGLAYLSPEPSAGSWWRTIEIRRPGERSLLRLALDSGPTAATLDASFFSTERPDRFERGEVLGKDALSSVVDEGPVP